MYKSCNIPAFSSLDPSTARAGEGRGGVEVSGDGAHCRAAAQGGAGRRAGRRVTGSPIG